MYGELIRFVENVNNEFSDEWFNALPIQMQNDPKVQLKFLTNRDDLLNKEWEQLPDVIKNNQVTKKFWPSMKKNDEDGLWADEKQSSDYDHDDENIE
jgi:Mn-containing catalase